MTIGRRVVNVTQKARGKEPIKYELEVIPYTAWEIPSGYERLLFAWERGSKLFVTDAEEVRPNRSVVWKQFLKQTATMYKGPDGFEPKDFAFKLQSVKTNSKGEEDRKTIAKIHVDLATYCTGQVNPQPVERTLTLKPFGKLKVSIKASWLKDAKTDPDAMTEMTGTSYGRKGDDYAQPDDYGEEYEQDLSGFVGGEGQDGNQDGGAELPRRSSRSSRNGRPRSKHRQKHLPEEIPEADEDEDPGGREHRKHRERRPKPRHDDEAWQQGNAPQAHTDDEFGAGIQIRKKSWKDYICCCLQPQVVAQPVETQEDQELLSHKQKFKRSDRQ